MSPLRDLESIINTIADPIFVKDRQHRWVLLNDSYCRFMGFERHQLIGKSDYDFFPRVEADVFWDKDEHVFQAGEENTNEEDFTDAAGITHSITTKKSLYVSPSGDKYIVGCIRDITAMKTARQELQRARDGLEMLVAERTAELEAANKALRQQILENEKTSDQLRQAQKMEAIGTLAGGIAHDFNNLLNIIIGYAAVLQQRPDADPTLREGAGQIAIAAEKAASLTRQLLAFSRKQVLQPEVLSVDEVLVTMSKMLPSLIGEDVELTITPLAHLGYVKADRGQIEQVIMNLVINARDAMPEGGRLSVSTANLDLNGDEDEEQCHEGIPAGQYLLLTISDSGVGMDPETQAHIFEPFFTTKAVGKGTGLGLSTVYGIVRQSGGHLSVHSERGHGTTLKIYLPRITDAVPVSTVEQHANVTCGGSETILLVEDQPALRKLLSEVLRAHGYKVLQAESGRVALDTATCHPGSIDLLITDVVMPGMRGWEVARRVGLMRPGTRVLYISGHTDTDLIQERAISSGEVLLEKPFKPDTLLSKIREILCSREQQRRASA